jgi:hypothetical protein
VRTFRGESERQDKTPEYLTQHRKNAVSWREDLREKKIPNYSKPLNFWSMDEIIPHARVSYPVWRSSGYAVD